jgi:hypothetical protein
VPWLTFVKEKCFSLFATVLLSLSCLSFASQSLVGEEAAAAATKNPQSHRHFWSIAVITVIKTDTLSLRKDDAAGFSLFSHVFAASLLTFTTSR